MKEIQEKLSAWGQLYKQCEQLELRLSAAKSIGPIQGGGSDRAAVEAELQALKVRAEVAFHEASHALRTREARAKAAKRA